MGLAAGGVADIGEQVDGARRAGAKNDGAAVKDEASAGVIEEKASVVVDDRPLGAVHRDHSAQSGSQASCVEERVPTKGEVGGGGGSVGRAEKEATARGDDDIAGDGGVFGRNQGARVHIDRSVVGVGGAGTSRGGTEVDIGGSADINVHISRQSRIEREVGVGGGAGVYVEGIAAGGPDRSVTDRVVNVG